MGIRKVTCFHQEAERWEKLRKYMRLKGVPHSRRARGFSMSGMFELLLEPIEKFVDGEGPDPFPANGRPMPPVQGADEPS